MNPRLARDEQGSSSLQLVILLPVLFSIMFLGVQAAMYYYARTLATAAAEEGARTAAAHNASPHDGAAAATSCIGRTGGGSVIEDSRVTVERTTTATTVTIRGFSLSVIPGWRITVTQSASAPIERPTKP